MVFSYAQQNAATRLFWIVSICLRITYVRCNNGVYGTRPCVVWYIRIEYTHTNTHGCDLSDQSAVAHLFRDRAHRARWQWEQSACQRAAAAAAARVATAIIVVVVVVDALFVGVVFLYT